MTYEDFKEEFEEKIIKKLPYKYRAIRLKIVKKEQIFKGAYDIVSFYDDRYPTLQIPSFNLTGVYQSVKKELTTDNIEKVIEDFAEELTTVLDDAFEAVEESIPEPELEKMRNIYKVYAEETLMKDVRFLEKIADEVKGSFFVVTAHPGVIVPEREIPDNIRDAFVERMQEYANQKNELQKLFFYQADNRNLIELQHN